MEKAWYQSKGAVGGLLVAASGIAAAIGLYLQGSLDFGSLVNQVVPLLGTGLGILGIRVAGK